MNLPAYSSIAAFLAHYEVLRAALAEGVPTASAANPADAATLAEIERILAELSATDSIALRQDVASALQTPGWDGPTTARHRARAELHLRRLLTVRGILAG